MSYQQEGNYADRKPLSKRQKRGEGDEKPKADEIMDLLDFQMRVVA